MLQQRSDPPHKGYDDDITSCWVRSTILDDFVINQGSDEMITTKNLHVQELWVARLILFYPSLDVRGHKQDKGCLVCIDT